MDEGDVVSTVSYPYVSAISISSAHIYADLRLLSQSPSSYVSIVSAISTVLRDDLIFGGNPSAVFGRPSFLAVVCRRRLLHVVS